VPRGIATSGPAILSYGFRPFFLLAGLYAVIAMLLWIGALSGLWTVGGSEGPIAWHAHEMLFGYASAALGGFVLTAVPNWTGRLPVSGRPLATLCALWLLGRVAGLGPSMFGSVGAAFLDSLFLPALAFAVAREVIAGHNWQNLRVAVAISILAALNIALHVTELGGGQTAPIIRATVTIYVLLICNVGGRVIPSFTRNYLARRGAARLPAPVDWFDHLSLLLALAAGLLWTVFPDTPMTAVACGVAALAQAVRLVRWRGYSSWREPLLLALHLGYAFIPLGFAMIALASLGILSPVSALHVLTVGGIGSMTLAIMTRATRGHTGRPLAASPLTTAAYACLFAAALARPVAELLPDVYYPVLAASALAWILAFALFVGEHAPMLMLPSVTTRARAATRLLRVEPTR
jgi:uncharacterized protein involved in response to NO